MRRQDKEITDLVQIFEVIEKCGIVHLGMVDNDMPYVVPLNFGYERVEDSLVLYFHSASEGRKIDILKKNPHVFFQMEYSYGLKEGSPDKPCTYSWKYECLMGRGEAEFIDDIAEKKRALNLILNHLTGTEGGYNYPDEMLGRTCVYRVRSSDFSGKMNG